LRPRVIFWLDFVVDLYGRAIAQLEYPRAHNLIAGVNAGNNSNLITK